MLQDLILLQKQKERKKYQDASGTNLKQHKNSHNKLSDVKFHVFNWVKVMARDLVQKVQRDFFPHMTQKNVHMVNPDGR